jgi:hypothetical protein
MAATIPARDLEERSKQLRRLFEWARHRQEELELMQKQFAQRRAVVRAKHQHLRADAAERRLVQGEDGRAAAALLGAAARATDLPPLDVWLRYVVLGGERSFVELSDILAGDLPVDSFSHDVLTVALNEHLMDRGSKPFLAYWDGTRRS